VEERGRRRGGERKRGCGKRGVGGKMKLEGWGEGRGVGGGGEKMQDQILSRGVGGSGRSPRGFEGRPAKAVHPSSQEKRRKAQEKLRGIFQRVPGYPVGNLGGGGNPWVEKLLGEKKPLRRRVCSLGGRKRHENSKHNRAPSKVKGSFKWWAKGKGLRETFKSEHRIARERTGGRSGGRHP